MYRITLGAVCILFTLSQAGTFTQGGQPPKIATDITAAEVQAVINAPTGGGDRQMKVVDMGKYNVSVGVLRRAKTKPGAPVGAINHEHVTEVYYIVSGAGTLLTPRDIVAMLKETLPHKPQGKAALVDQINQRHACRRSAIESRHRSQRNPAGRVRPPP